METIKLYELKKSETSFPRIKISYSKDSYDLIKKFYSGDIGIFESFFIILLDRSNHTIAYSKIGQGGINGVVVDVRLIAKYAIDGLASGIILAHNHPSGNMKPSQQDKDITNQIKSALKLLSIQVIDHIILGENEYYSFADNCMI